MGLAGAPVFDSEAFFKSLAIILLEMYDPLVEFLMASKMSLTDCEMLAEMLMLARIEVTFNVPFNIGRIYVLLEFT